MRLEYILFIVLLSCGSIQKMGLRSTSPLFKKAGDLTIREKNWDFFRQSAPGSLKLTELLYLQDPENESLHLSLIKGYSGYAYAVSETLAFEDELSGVSDQTHAKEAMEMYTRALDYGLDFLKRKGIERSELLTLPETELHKKFDQEIDEEELTAVLFTGQAWGSLINFQKDNMALVSQIPRVKSMFDWVCKKDPNIENGLCDIFYAQYEASRPKMLGGNPELAKKLYAQAMKKNPKNLLIRLGYVQFMLLPAQESEPYEKEAKILREEFGLWEDLSRDDLENHSPYRNAQDFNLFNAIAKKRFEIIEKNKSKIF